MDCDFIIDCGPSSTPQVVETIDVDAHNTTKSAKTKVPLCPIALKKLFQDYKTSLINHDREKQKQKQTEHDKFQEEMGWTGKGEFAFNLAADFLKENDKRVHVSKSSVIVPEEKLARIPNAVTSKKELVKLRREEREKTKGPAWYGLSAPEITPEIKNDLEILQMRSALDPKRFYKKNDFKVLPKYFQIGKFMDSPLDYYNNRLTKKERKRTLVEELMANDSFNRTNKKRYKEIILNRQKTSYKEWKNSKHGRRAYYKELKKTKQGKKKTSKQQTK